MIRQLLTHKYNNFVTTNNIKGEKKMNDTTIKFLSSLKFGEVQTTENLSIVPIFQVNGKTLPFISLDNGVKKGYVEIQEVSSTGSVPDLNLINHSDYYVFILHGDELLGAKQNRTVNTSMLINKKSNVVIPVTCVERGRWNYVSKKFQTSDFIIPAELKKRTMFAANDSLKRNMGFRADQGEIWEKIEEISLKAKVMSKTSSLYDVQKNYDKICEDLLSNFKLLPEQKGIVAFINGKIQGVEFISRKSVFRKYHKKILKSFAFSAILSDEKKTDISPDFCLSQIKETLDAIKTKEWKGFKSVGLGFDYRYDTEKSAGSILLADQNVISFNYYFDN